MLLARINIKILTQLVLLIVFIDSSQAATVIATSVLPVSEYTRITIESDQTLIYTTLTLTNPDRIVLDLKNTPDNTKIKALSNKLLPTDPTIKQIRVGKFQQSIMRVVIDLRANATAKITQYPPASGYQHRLALDIIPTQSMLAVDDGIVNDSAVDNVSQSTTKSIKDSDNGAKIILDRAPVFESDLQSEPN